jgi:hypothetical protein
MHTLEPLIPKSSPFDAEIAIEKLKRCKFLGIHQISEELIHTQAGGNTLRSEIHKLITSMK